MRVTVAMRWPLYRRGIRAVLEASDLELVGEVDNGDALIESISRYKPDIVVMDFDLPCLSKETLIRRIRDIIPTIGIIVISNDGSYLSLLSAMEAGAASYLLMDASEAQLIQAIEAVYCGEAIANLDIFRQAILSTKYSRKHNPIAGLLSPAELEVLKLASRGISNKAIARHLFLSERTVHGYFRSIFSKMAVNSRTEAIYKAFKNKWISLD